MTVLSSRTRRRRLMPVLALSFLLTPLTAYAQTAHYGIALHGDPLYPADFSHFTYTNPDAPKGGDLHLSGLNTFDTINPFTLKGVPAEGSEMVFETLMASSMDEPASQYGWIAQSVTVAPDHTWVSYQLRPEARFSDGTPITPEDIIFFF